MIDHTDAQIIEDLDVRVRVQASTMSDAQAKAGEREITVEVFAREIDLSEQYFVAQLDWKPELTPAERVADVMAQLDDDLCNNFEIEEETLIRGFSFECGEGQDDEFEDAREHLENVVCQHAMNVARVTVEALLAPAED